MKRTLAVNPIQILRIDRLDMGRWDDIVTAPRSDETDKGTGMNMRIANLKDLAQILDWAADEGWNPGLGDAAGFFAADPDGFFVAEQGGALVAAISVVAHSAEFAFLGLYLCHPEFRGQGIGYSLWKHALDHAGTRTVGLDGVADQQANYAKSGFVKTGSSVRYEGVLPPVASRNVRLADDADAGVISTLDQQANGVTRPRFLNAWIAQTDTRKTLVLCSGSEVTGFATIRRCRQGVKVGPVIAPDTAQALELTKGALQALPSDHVIIDVPSENTALTNTLIGAGFESSFATARMWRGTPPVASGTLAAIATMELG
ncbi:GNAT family N-acetyltransferase [Shimia sp.]|uniref:GNAT family N-acetyltransferase n=1 Tax=Shimia sp. TaxID=1954381 RepID=UPI003297D0B3